MLNIEREFNKEKSAEENIYRKKVIKIIVIHRVFPCSSGSMAAPLNCVTPTFLQNNQFRLS